MSNPTSPIPYCTFYIVRHGQTEWNVARRMQGHSDSPLTSKGIEDAKELAQLFKKIHFDAAFASDLLRAQRTAEIIALEQKIVVTTTHLLRERGFGRFEGKRYEEYESDLRELLDHMETLTDAERFKHKLEPDIESDEEIIGRFITFLRQTAVAYPGKKVLIVSHGGMLRALLIHLGYAPRAELPSGIIKNLGYFTLDSDGVDFFVRDASNLKK